MDAVAYTKTGELRPATSPAAPRRRRTPREGKTREGTTPRESTLREGTPLEGGGSGGGGGGGGGGGIWRRHRGSRRTWAPTSIRCMAVSGWTAVRPVDSLVK